jgi:hypothetical protein
MCKHIIVQTVMCIYLPTPACLGQMALLAQHVTTNVPRGTRRWAAFDTFMYSIVFDL